MVLVLDELDDETGAPIALGADVAAVQLDDLLGEREADAGAAVTPRLGSVDLEETLEEALRQLGRKAGAVVLHHHPGGAREIV